MTNQTKRRVLLIGPIILDKNNSGGEGEKLYQQLLAEGYEVHKRSIHRNKFLRLFNTLWFILVQHKKYDIAILMLFSGKAFVLEFLSTVMLNMLKKPIVGVIHGGAFHHFYSQFPETTDYVFNRINQLYSPSHFLINYFSARGHHVAYLPNFINLEAFDFKPKPNFELKFVWVRGLHNIYNPQTAIRAIAELSVNHPNIHLTMIGADKGELHNCQQLVKQLSLDKHVTFAGYIQNHELPNKLHQFDAFLNTTSYESFGVSLIEAAACGLPIISSAVGEIPMIWKHEENILLYKEESLNDLINQMEKLITSSKIREKLINNGNLIARQYQWSDIAPKWFKILSNTKN